MSDRYSLTLLLQERARDVMRARRCSSALGQRRAELWRDVRAARLREIASRARLTELAARARVAMAARQTAGTVQRRVRHRQWAHREHRVAQAQVAALMAQLTAQERLVERARAHLQAAILAHRAVLRHHGRWLRERARRERVVRSAAFSDLLACRAHAQASPGSGRL